jgi:squalene-hopene/tetraprenyl-beta-curcumene cyclase
MLRAAFFGKWVFCLAALLGLSAGAVSAAEKVSAKDVEAMTAKAIDYLRTKGQKEDGSFSPNTGSAVTSLVTTALLKQGRTPDDPMVAKALKYIETFVREDGGIHAQDSKQINYETCIAMMCFAEANKDGRYDKTLKKADAFLKGQQWHELQGKEKSDPYYGGTGYGNDKRPDLSNTTFMIDALKAAGNDENSEAIQRALVFVSRCQNLETEHNTTPFAAKKPDGGFYYTPAAGGQSQAGTTEEGALRSYGSMTYAGLKSMIFAGVKKDDKRVQAAITWLSKNYKLDENPGMGDAGLYYYYHTFAKSLDALGQDTFKDDKGVEHDWRQELLATLKAKQQPDGSFINENNKWLEGDANLVTGYALLALSYAQPKK